MTPEELDEAFRKKMDELQLTEFEYRAYVRMHYEEIAPRVLAVWIVLVASALTVEKVLVMSEDIVANTFIAGAFITILGVVANIPVLEFRAPTHKWKREFSLSKYLQNGGVMWRIKQGMFGEIKRRKKAIRKAAKELAFKEKQQLNAEHLVMPGFMARTSAYIKHWLGQKKQPEPKQIDEKLLIAAISDKLAESDRKLTFADEEQIKRELKNSGIKDF